MRMLFFVGVTLFVLHGIVHAEFMYVTDKVEIVIREGKGMEYKIVGVARSNDKVEVLNTEGEYANIRLASGTEGWVLSRYLTETLPKNMMITGLSGEIEQFKEKLKSAQDESSRLNDEKNSLENTRQMLEKKLLALEAENQEIRTGCADFVKLRDDHEKLKTEMKSTRESLASLTVENEDLRENTRLMWFIFGAAAVLSGFVIGMYLQSLRNKRRRQISF